MNKEDEKVGKHGIVVLVVVIALVGLFTWAIATAEYSKNLRARERYTYTGRVTAIEVGEVISEVYLNSNEEVLPIQSSGLQLAVGEEYEIVVDGNWKLINARIVEDSEYMGK